MLSLLAHQGQPPAPHDVVGSWNLDPVLLLGLGTAAVLYERGYRRRDGSMRRWAFHGALVALVVALISPVEALSGALLSVHMVQHVLLLVVAAPLLAWSAPGAALSRGLPDVARGWPRSLRRTVSLDADRLRRSRSPIGRWVLYVAVVWAWHAAALYAAAVEHEPVHLLEHVSFLGVAFLLWSVLLGPARVRVEPGAGVLLIFTLGMQSTFLSVLLTFSTSAWYEPYLEAAPAWGVDALADQHLAGVVMWVPAGLLNTAIGLALFVSWLRRIEDRSTPDPESGPARATAST